MPIEFSTSLELDVLYARWEGVVDLNEFKSNFVAYLNDRYYRPGRPEFIDLSRLVDFDVNFNTVRALLRMVNAQVPGTTVETGTYVWAPNEAMYGLARMYQQLAELSDGIKVEVFRHAEPVFAAMDLPYQTVEQMLAAHEFLPHERIEQRDAGT